MYISKPTIITQAVTRPTANPIAKAFLSVSSDLSTFWQVASDPRFDVGTCGVACGVVWT